MKFNNGLEMNIQKSYYNKAIKGKNNVYEVDTKHEYPLYELNIYKNYRDKNTKEECLDQIILDLESTLHQLEEMKYRGEREI